MTPTEIIPVLQLLDKANGMDEVVRSVPQYRAAAALLERCIGEYAGTILDGKYIEVPSMDLVRACESEGVTFGSMQFVLNCLRLDVYSFGGRRADKALSECEVVRMLARLARGEGEEEGAETVPVHRFVAECLLVPSVLC